MTKILTKGVHIRIDNSIDKRKQILESALLTAKLLQEYENLKVIRNEKLKQLSLLKKIIKEIKILFNNLEYKELPEVKLPKPKESKKPSKKIKTIKQEEPKTKLQLELEEIRKKLENLKI